MKPERLCRDIIAMGIEAASIAHELEQYQPS